MKTRTHVASLTLAVISLLVLNGCVRPLSSKPSNESAAAAATVAAAKATEAAAVQIIAQATQNAQRPTTATSGHTPAPIATTTSAPKATSTTSPSGGSEGTWTVRGEDVFGNATEQQFPVGQGLAGPVPMPPGMGNLPLIAQMVGGSGATAADTPTAAPLPTPVVLDTRTAVQIRYGDMVTQTIKSSGDVGIYTFDGKAGDVAFILAAGTADASWLELQIELYDPQGQPVLAVYGGHDEYDLSADGRYVFTVRDAGTRIGPYNVLLKNASLGAGTRLTYDNSVGAKITIPGDTHSYAFSGRAGDIARVALTGRGEGTQEWTVGLFDVDGKPLAGDRTWGPSGFTAIIERPLTSDGEYTVKVQVTGLLSTTKTGTYTLLVKNVAAKAGIWLTYGDVVTGTIAPQGDKDVYVFEWKAGEKAVIETGSGPGYFSSGFNPQIEIFDSRGNSLAKSAASYEQPIIQIRPPLSEPGLYLVIIEGQKLVFWDTGTYTLSLKNLAAP